MESRIKRLFDAIVCKEECENLITDKLKMMQEIERRNEERIEAWKKNALKFWCCNRIKVGIPLLIKGIC